MTPNLELYNAIYKYCQNWLGFETYDTPPLLEVAYPFIVLGSLESNPTNYKTAFYSKNTITLDVWGNENMKADVLQALEKLAKLPNIKTDHYQFISRLKENQTELITDTSVKDTVLNHGIATLVFDCMPRG